MDGNHNDDFSGDYKGSNLSLNNTDVSVSKSASFTIEKGKTGGHGMCLTTSDHDRLRIFIHEFTVRALIPWAERQMKLLSDVVCMSLVHVILFEPRREKTGLRGFRPGPTQTGLYKLRKELEA